MSGEHDTGVRSYVPGEWYAVFGPRASVVLPPSEKARVAALWELVDGGAGFDETLDALISSGLRDLPGFVLVSRSEDETKVVLRGAARATFTTAERTVELAGSAATTWVEQTLRGVTGMSLELGEADDADGADEDAEPPHALGELRIATGLVRLSRVDEPPYVEPVVERRYAAPQHLAEVVEPVPEPEAVDLGPDTEPHPSPERPSEPEPQPEPVPEPDLEPDPEPEPERDLLDDLLGGPPEDDDTVLGLLDSAFPVDDPLGPPAPAMPPPGPLGPPPAGPPPLAPPPASPPPPSPPRESPVARLLFSVGEPVEVDRVVLVGRAPEARRFTSTDQPRLVTVPSPHQEISSTHLEIRPGTGADHGLAVVTDLGSTNGTVLRQPGLSPEELSAGRSVQLLPGAVIDLGDGVTIEVARP